MTQIEKLRIAVAEADGWTDIKERDFCDFTDDPYADGPQQTLVGYPPDAGALDKIPPYTTDRNEIIGAIERMSSEEQTAIGRLFIGMLAESFAVEPNPVVKLVTAPPETLCRLYLKAKGIDFE